MKVSIIKEDGIVYPEYVIQLSDRINQMLFIADTSGLILYLAATNHSRYGWEYEREGFATNKKANQIPRDGPNDLLQIINDNNTRDLIYLSKYAWESSPIHFAWFYTHEIKHILQNLNYPRLEWLIMRLGGLYDEKEIRRNPKEYVERDGNEAAIYILRSFFPQEEITKFFDERVKKGDYREILGREGTLNYNPEKETEERIRSLDPNHDLVQEFLNKIKSRGQLRNT